MGVRRLLQPPSTSKTFDGLCIPCRNRERLHTANPQKGRARPRSGRAGWVG